jgi:hypothetical protein
MDQIGSHATEVVKILYNEGEIFKFFNTLLRSYIYAVI